MRKHKNLPIFNSMNKKSIVNLLVILEHGMDVRDGRETFGKGEITYDRLEPNL